MKVRINATGDTIVMKFVRPSPDVKLEGYILGYGSSMFSKQFIQLPENGQPYETEMGKTGYGGLNRTSLFNYSNYFIGGYFNNLFLLHFSPYTRFHWCSLRIFRLWWTASSSLMILDFVFIRSEI